MKNRLTQSFMSEAGAIRCTMRSEQLCDKILACKAIYGEIYSDQNSRFEFD